MGIDVVEIARLEHSLERTPALAARLFTDGERGLPGRSLAARFAAKEALAKSLGAPRGLLWTDAEVLRDPGTGRPELAVRGTVAAAAASLGVTRWHVSLSHDAGIATAIVIAEGLLTQHQWPIDTPVAVSVAHSSAGVVETRWRA